MNNKLQNSEHMNNKMLNTGHDIKQKITTNNGRLHEAIKQKHAETTQQKDNIRKKCNSHDTAAKYKQKNE